KIAARRLAGDRRHPENAEYVVTQLKRLTDRGAVSAEQRHRAGTAAGKYRAGLQRPAHRVVARLAPGHVQHARQGRKGAGLVEKVGELTDREFGAHSVVVRPRP